MGENCKLPVWLRACERAYVLDLIGEMAAVVIGCPKCGSPLYNTVKGAECRKCGYVVPLGEAEVS